jgi:hypothetical protein
MSKLMDNPLGNVAMLWNQFDYSRLKNPANDETAYKGNYMGIAQFPKGLGKDWNLINRVIWNVPSMPLDQGKIDRADQLYASALGGAVLPPGTGGPAPIDLFDGRTTGFGDMYYVGLFSPKKPIELDGVARWSGVSALISRRRRPATRSSAPASGVRDRPRSASTWDRSGRSAPWVSSTGTSPGTATVTVST